MLMTPPSLVTVQPIVCMQEITISQDLREFVVGACGFHWNLNLLV
jgi:hypothetical protein